MGHQNLFGSIAMVFAMAAFALEDALLKTIAAMLPVSQILLFFGLFGSTVFICLIKYKKLPLFPEEIYSMPMHLRVFLEIAGRIFYTLAIVLTPLSSATVILQATPIVVVAGAVLVFKEKVGILRWTAILLGFLGVVIIIRPGSNDFSILSLLAVLGMFGFAGRDLASRAAPKSLNLMTLGMHGFLSVAMAGMMLSFWDNSAFVWPDIKTFANLIIAMLIGVFAYAALMMAMRTGEVSAVTPFRYTRLLFGITLGVLLFEEELTLPIVLGSAMIVLSGLFILWRGESKKNYCKSDI